MPFQMFRYLCGSLCENLESRLLPPEQILGCMRNLMCMVAEQDIHDHGGDPATGAVSQLKWLKEMAKWLLTLNNRYRYCLDTFVY